MTKDAANNRPRRSIHELKAGHRRRMEPGRREKFRADTVKLVRKQLGNISNLLAAGGLERPIAMMIGKELVSGDPAEVARLDLTDPLWNYVVRSGIKELILEGKPIPPELRQVAASFIDGTVELPKRVRGREENPALMFAIREQVRNLVAVGWPITPAKGTDTACDIVAEAVGAEGLASVTPDRIRKIFYDAEYAKIEEKAKNLRESLGPK